MSEQLPNRNEYERRSISPALDLFRSDLRTLTNEISLGMAFQRYLREELEISEEEADMLHLQMLRKGAISEASDFNQDQLQLKNDYRIALFTEVRPQYLLHHTTDEYDEWLCEVIATMLADNSRHDLDICLRTNGRDVTECEQGRCPIRVIEDETIRIHMNPDFNAFEYIADKDRAYREAEILLTHAKACGIISDSYRYTLEKRYDAQSKDYFGLQR